jgi:hypothetical protein
VKIPTFVLALLFFGVIWWHWDGIWEWLGGKKSLEQWQAEGQRDYEHERGRNLNRQFQKNRPYDGSPRSHGAMDRETQTFEEEKKNMRRWRGNARGQEPSPIFQTPGVRCGYNVVQQGDNYSLESPVGCGGRTNLVLSTAEEMTGEASWSNDTEPVFRDSFGAALPCRRSGDKWTCKFPARTHVSIITVEGGTLNLKTNTTPLISERPNF